LLINMLVYHLLVQGKKCIFIQNLVHGIVCIGRDILNIQCKY